MPAPSAQWEFERLRLQPALLWAIAWSSLRLRLWRSLLTLLTIAACCGFVQFLLAAPPPEEAADRQKWQLMLVLSLLVSVAGVFNTILMSVTQRQREIGTIKCLGALDSLVLLSILLEAALLGLCGALLGCVFGLLAALLLSWVAAAPVPGPGRLLLQALSVLGLGMFLSAAGAAWPAFWAARKPPVDAMGRDR